MTVLASTIRGNTSGPAGSGGAGGVADAGGAGGTGGDAAGGGGLSVAEGSMQIANSTFASNTTGDGGTGGAGGPGTTTGGGGGRGGPGGGGGGVLATNPIAGLLQGVTAVGNAAGTGGSGGQGGAGTAAGAAGATGAAGAGGAVLGFAAATAIQDSILASNGATNCAGSIQDAGHNLTFSGAGCPATFLTGDPNLGPLEDNGGPAATVSLGPGSAALDKVPARGAGCQPTDERGVARPSGPACDIGAYELAPPKATSGVAGPIGTTTATLNGTVIPNARDATVQFVYGTTTKYGSKSAVQHVSGVIAVPVVAKLTRLKAKVTYHYRIVVTSSDGVGTSVDRTFRTSPAPVITALKIKPSAFRAGGKPATITYSDTLPASVTFVVLTRRGKRLVSVGRFRHTDKVGANTVTFTGRVGGRKLQRGSYRLQATPRANRLNGKQVSLTFRITG